MSTMTVSMAPVHRQRPASAPARRTAAGPLRLTRRGRLLLVFAVMALMVVAGLVLGHGSSQAGSGQSVAPHSVTVQPGDTLWSVANRVAPHQDPRLVIDKLESMNNLSGGQVIAGQRLLIPTF